MQEIRTDRQRWRALCLILVISSMWNSGSESAPRRGHTVLAQDAESVVKLVIH